jgi:hypothetical protein
MENPEYLRWLAIQKMGEVSTRGDTLTSGQDRKDLLIALNRERDEKKWLDIIREFVVVVTPADIAAVKHEENAPVVDAVMKKVEERKLDRKEKQKRARLIREQRRRAEKEQQKIEDARKKAIEARKEKQGAD